MSSIAAPMSFDQYKKNAPKQGGYMGKYERTGNIEQVSTHKLLSPNFINFIVKSFSSDEALKVNFIIKVTGIRD